MIMNYLGETIAESLNAESRECPLRMGPLLVHEWWVSIPLTSLLSIE
jgi:hypothetical protein